MFIARNLTSDLNTGLGRWSEAEIAAAIRDGRSRDGRVLNFWGMPWIYFHNLTPEDADAIARCLKTLPAVHNEIPPPLHYGFLETIAAKFWLGDPLLGQAPRLTYAIGSYANLGGPNASSIATGLAWAQAVVLVVGLILIALAPRRAGARGAWLRTTGIVVAGIVVLAVGYFLDATPATPILPPEEASKGASGGIPRPDVSQAPAERAVLVERGRYIFANASCALCHGNDGAGGLKVNGDFGTIFAANISTAILASAPGATPRSPVHPQRRQPRRTLALLAGHAVGSLLQSRRGGRRLADRLPAPAAAGRPQNPALSAAGAG